MPSYLITGASRGLGFAFLQNLSSDPANTVFGLVRNVADTEVKIAGWNRKNIHIMQGDLNDYESLKKAAEATAKLTESLDCLIANAAFIPHWGLYDMPSVLGEDPVRFESELMEQFRINCVGNIHLFNLFMPLILKGNVKKVVTISSGNGDMELVRKYNLHENMAYSISKIAVNMAVAKFSAQYAKDGVLFLSVCPGVVETGHMSGTSEHEVPKLMDMVEKFKSYSPDFAGASQPEDSAKRVLSVIESKSVENGDGGAFVSQFGTKKWL